MTMGREDEIVAIRAGRPRPIPCYLNIRRQNAKHQLSSDDPFAFVGMHIMANSGVHVMWHRFRCARGGGARMRHAGAYTKQGRYKYSGENDRFHRRASHQGGQPTRGSGVQRALVAVYSRHGVMFGGCVFCRHAMAEQTYCANLWMPA